MTTERQTIQRWVWKRLRRSWAEVNLGRVKERRSQREITKRRRRTIRRRKRRPRKARMLPLQPRVRISWISWDVTAALVQIPLSRLRRTKPSLEARC